MRGADLTEYPAIFWDIVESLGGGMTARQVHDAVYAAFDAADTATSREGVLRVYREMLREVVTPYAESLNMTPDRVSDALVAAMQMHESDVAPKPRRGR